MSADISSLWTEFRRRAAGARTPNDLVRVGQALDDLNKAAELGVPSFEVLFGLLSDSLADPATTHPQLVFEALDDMSEALSAEAPFKHLHEEWTQERALSDAKKCRHLEHQRRFLLAALIHQHGWPGDIELIPFCEGDEADPDPSPDLKKSCDIVAAMERASGRSISSSMVKKSYDIIRRNGALLPASSADEEMRYARLVEALRAHAPTSRGRPTA